MHAITVANLKNYYTDTVASLNNYYNRVVRGIDCYRSGKKCKQQDKNAVWQVGGAIGALLVILGYTQFMRTRNLRQEETTDEIYDITERREKIEQSAAQDVYAMLRRGDIAEVTLFAANQENLKKILNNGDSPLSYAIEKALTKNDEASMTVVEILLNQGAIKYNKNLSDDIIRKMENAPEIRKNRITRIKQLMRKADRKELQAGKRVIEE